MRAVTSKLGGLIAFMVLAIACLPALEAHAAPEPNPVPTRWQLQIEPGDLRAGVVEVDGIAQTYFYFTYTVTNRTGEDRYFAPSFDLATDDGTLIRSGRDVPNKVYDVLIERIENPLLEAEIAILGQLQQGKENAKDGLVVWKADNMKVDSVKVFAAGFSGETKRYKRPDNGEEVVLRKQLMLRHTVPGTIDPRHDPKIRRIGVDRWIMR